MPIDPFDEPLMHHQNVRTARDLGMNANREDERVVRTVAPCEHVFPGAFDGIRINIAMLSKLLASEIEMMYEYHTALGRAPSHWNGGQSSNVQFAGISTTSLFSACFIGTIQCSGSFL
jgi:hypothetical protein